MVRAALPTVLILQELHFRASASRTDHAILPSPRLYIFPATLRAGEVNYGFLKRFWLRFHAQILAQMRGLVNYIIALN